MNKEQIDFNLKKFSKDILEIKNLKRENYIDYEPVCKFLRELLLKYNLCVKKNIVYNTLEYTQYLFLADELHTEYYEIYEKKSSTAKSYLMYVIKSVEVCCKNKTLDGINEFVKAIVVAINTIYPIPYQNEFRHFNNDYDQINDYGVYKNYDNETCSCTDFETKPCIIYSTFDNPNKPSYKYSSVRQFKIIKHNLMMALLSCLLSLKEFNTAINFFKSYNGIFDITNIDFFNMFLSMKMVNDTYLSFSKDKSFDLYNVMTKKLNIMQDNKQYDTFSDIVNKKEDDEYKQECSFQLMKSYMNFIVSKISKENLLYLHELFECASLDNNEYVCYLKNILTYFENAYKNNIKLLSVDVRQKIEKFIKNAYTCINENKLNDSLKKLFSLTQKVTDSFLLEDWPKEIVYWISILNLESRNIFFNDSQFNYLEMVENIITDEIDRYSENNLNFEEKCSLAERFFKNALKVESDLARKVNNYVRDRNHELIISNKDCVNNIKNNKKLLNIIAGSESVFEQYEELDKIAFNGDYTNIIVAPIKAIERYLKEILVQKYNDILIPHITNNNYTHCDRYLKIKSNTELSAELLSENNEYNDSNIDIVNQNGENLYRQQRDGRRIQERFKPFELGTVCCSLRKILNDSQNTHTIFGYLRGDQNSDEAFLIQKLFIQRTRNGYLHIHTIDNYDKAKKSYYETAFWLKECIDCFKTFKLQDKPIKQ